MSGRTTWIISWRAEVIPDNGKVALIIWLLVVACDARAKNRTRKVTPTCDTLNSVGFLVYMTPPLSNERMRMPRTRQRPRLDY